MVGSSTEIALLKMEMVLPGVLPRTMQMERTRNGLTAVLIVM